ncbi:MAG: HoxN/HupN/NixA family nickel/cobalt transporter [Acidobacteriota bacterium]|nr:HoxN/HupN/NixA family nickel/cobalt transporter [Acidobacteriota bacterium]MDE3044047.1 HoxN/HupN/NixA family nickel/cobalt transporter [Acidobacteriota bacterium]
MATLTTTPVTRREKIRATFSPSEWRRLSGMFGFIGLLHVLGWGLIIFASTRHFHVGGGKMLGVGTGVLAYTLGMRHAFDADHIAAIDNTTRKFMSEGKRPMSVGFFFSLGHSSVVFVLTLLLGLGARALGAQVRNSNSGLHHWGGLVGTAVSGTFLYLIAILNLVILVGIVKLFVTMRHGRYDDSELEKHLNARGFMMRFFGPIARSVDAPWKMYPLGVLFGLGFDTATEVAFLVLAGTSVAAGMPLWAILSLPLLFAAGMSILDTIDGSFMNFAYGWAFSKPVRKVYYNMAITGLSVFVALYIGTLELAQVFATQLHLRGGVWSYARGFNINKAGFTIVGIFVVVWVVALGWWRYGRVEERWERAALRAQAARGESPDLHSAGIVLGAVHRPFTIDED